MHKSPSIAMGFLLSEDGTDEHRAALWHPYLLPLRIAVALNSVMDSLCAVLSMPSLG